MLLPDGWTDHSEVAEPHHWVQQLEALIAAITKRFLLGRSGRLKGKKPNSNNKWYQPRFHSAAQRVRHLFLFRFRQLKEVADIGTGHRSAIYRLHVIPITDLDLKCYSGITDRLINDSSRTLFYYVANFTAIETILKDFFFWGGRIQAKMNFISIIDWFIAFIVSSGLF